MATQRRKRKSDPKTTAAKAPAGEKPPSTPFDNIREPKKRAFLAAYQTTGTITTAARAAGVSQSLHFVWIKTDKKYAEAFDKTKEAFADLLETAAIRRAVQGVQRLKFHKGRPIIDPATGKHYAEVEFSDILLIFLLKKHRPEFRDATPAGDGYRDGVRDVLSAAALMKEFQTRARQLPAIANGSTPAVLDDGHGSNGHSNGNGNGHVKKITARVTKPPPPPDDSVSEDESDDGESDTDD